jgi:short-subunit dehydrogenase
MPYTIITGASAGIGYETAKGLASKGHNLILVARSFEKLKQIRKNLLAQYAIECDIYSYDLSLIQSNINFSNKIVQKYKDIHILINNVGAIFMGRQITNEGLEKTFALNHMSYFTLSTLLIKKYSLIKIINVSSEAHRYISLISDDFQNAKQYYGWHAYKRSKLANIYLTYKLDEIFKNTKATFNCLHPGLVNTQFADNNSLMYKFSASIIKYFGITPAEGALTSIYLASNNNIDMATGLYFDKCKARKSSKESYDNEMSQQLWEYSEQLLFKYLK